jgi:hypothetical protein
MPQHLLEMGFFFFLETQWSTSQTMSDWCGITSVNSVHNGGKFTQIEVVLGEDITVGDE